MRAGGSCQGRGDGGESPGLHGAKRRKVGETGSPALTAGGRSPRESLPSLGGFTFGAFFLLDTIDSSRPACLVRAPNHSLVARSPKTFGEDGRSLIGPVRLGERRQSQALSAIPFPQSRSILVALTLPSRGS